MRILFFTFLLVVITGCNDCYNNGHAQKEGTIINKSHHKTGLQDTDTLWVSQNDTLVFKVEEVVQRYPDQSPKLVMHYELRNPIDNAYYFIYNDAQQLIKEGKYTARYVYEGKIIEQGNFYNSKAREI